MQRGLPIPTTEVDSGESDRTVSVAEFCIDVWQWPERLDGRIFDGAVVHSKSIHGERALRTDEWSGYPFGSGNCLDQSKL